MGAGQNASVEIAVKCAKVPISSLLSADSPRLRGVDKGHVARLAEIGRELPPILVHRKNMRVIDGMHRLRAAMHLGFNEIEVEFFDGSDEEAFIRSVEINTAHGLPLSLLERKAAAARILSMDPEISDRATAKITGLSAKTVGAIRSRSSEEIPQLNRRRGHDGRLRPVNGTAGRQLAAELIKKNPEASLRQIALDAGVSLGTVHSVREQLRAYESGAVIPSHQPAAGRARDLAVDSKDNLLPKLRRDPSLQLNEHGRELLRWLDCHAIRQDDWSQLAAAVPKRWMMAVAEIARQSAVAWSGLARHLEEQAANSTKELCGVVSSARTQGS